MFTITTGNDTRHLANFFGSLSPQGIQRQYLQPGVAFNFDRYLAPHSDVLPQLVHEHQVGFVNRAVEASYRTRTALADGQGKLTPADAAMVEKQARGLARYLLFADEVPLPPGGVKGLDVVELGCGTGYVSGWLAARGARPVGIDNSPRQLETARACQAEFGRPYPILLGNAETLPFPDASFDLVIAVAVLEHVADPFRCVAEMRRVLAPSGHVYAVTPFLQPVHMGAYDFTRFTPIGHRRLFRWHAIRRIAERFF